MKGRIQMKKGICLLLCLMFALGTGFAHAQEEPQGLSSLALSYGFKMGAPLSFGQMWDSAYLDFVAKNFNSVTMTNEMKAYSMLDERRSRSSGDDMPQINFSMADKMVQWAADNGIGVRGHVLVWDAYMTDWYFHEGYDPAKPYADQETIRKRTRSYIEQVITHFEQTFPGTVYCWDVVNEAVGDSPAEYDASDPRHLRTARNGGANLFQKYMGNDYVEYAFLYAKDTVEALGADIKLYYNDYNAYFPEKAAAILSLADSVNHFDGDRVLCDGIGMQGYIGGYGTQEGCLEQSHLALIRSAILGYAAKGLEVQITEMAVRNFDPAQSERHAEYYRDLFRVFLSLNTQEDPPLKAVSIWGLTDDPQAKKGSYTYNLNSPYGGLVDEHLNPKKAYELVYELMAK